jgi:uncharacterized protein HemX
MSEERITERTDGVTTERVTERGEPTHTTTVVERRGGGGGMLVGLAVLIAVLVGAWFLFAEGQNDAAETKAITEAAQTVGDSAEKAGDAVVDAVDGESKK